MPSSHLWQLYLYWAMALLFILLDCKSLHFRKYMFNTLWHFPNLMIIFKDTLVMVHLMIFYSHSKINNKSFLISLFCDSFRLNTCVLCFYFIKKYYICLQTVWIFRIVLSGTIFWFQYFFCYETLACLIQNNFIMIFISALKWLHEINF